jgi:hypothetical protein
VCRLSYHSLSNYQTQSCQNYQVTADSFDDTWCIWTYEPLLGYRTTIAIPIENYPFVLSLLLLQNLKESSLFENNLNVGVFPRVLNCFDLRFYHFTVALQIVTIRVQNCQYFTEPLAKNYSVIESFKTCFRAIKKKKHFCSVFVRCFDDSEIEFGLIHKLPNPWTKVITTRLESFAAYEAE